MKASRKSVLALIGAMAMGAAMAAPSVEIVSVQQQYPWTNTVDIVYQVEGVTNMDYFVTFTPTTSAGVGIPDVNGQYDIQVALTNSGTYTAQWYPQTNQQYTACRMTPSVFRGAAKDYMIVDLENWTVTYEPMATQEASNQRYQADEYKTKKLVLRRIPAGDDYAIGGPESTTIGNIGPNSPHTVTFATDYYFAIYPLTVAQYSRIMGGAVSNSRMPQTGKSWNDVRGSALSGAIPTTGLFATLNAKTQLRGFDLPTDSMWEVAARAGSDSLYLSGESSASMTDFGWCLENSGRVAHEVGLLKANDWGLYDLYGNYYEYVRDTLSSADLALQTDGLKPVTAGTASQWAGAGAATVFRGGGFSNGKSEVTMRFSGRMGNSKVSASWQIRVSYFPQ